MVAYFLECLLLFDSRCLMFVLLDLFVLWLEIPILHFPFFVDIVLLARRF